MTSNAVNNINDPDGHHAGHDDHASHGDHAGHDDHAGHGDHGDHAGHDHHSPEAFRDRFWLTLVLAVPVIVLSPMVANLLGYSVPDFPGSTLVPPVLGTVIYFYGGMPFLKGAVTEAKARQPGMMMLVSMAITVAFVASLATSANIGNIELDFWWELALLVVIMLLGHWIEMRALQSASWALDALAELIPDEAERITETGIETVPPALLEVGDVVLVRPGGRVPVDGDIDDGTAHFDESMITGESVPVERAEGDRVVAGTIADNSVRIRVSAVGEDTELAGIRKLVDHAQQSSSRAQALADRAAAYLFWFALIVALMTAVVWMIVGTPTDAVTRSVTVLVIACPHALGLAIPLVTAISTEKAARAGVLVKDRLALERMRKIDTVLFDKTGTLTRGEHELTGIVAVSEDESTVLRLAAGAESASEHPVAHAIGDAAQGDIAPARDHEALPGRGVQANVDGARVAVGGPNLIRERELEVPAEVDDRTSQWQERGAGILYVIRDSDVIGALAVEDSVRDESRAVVEGLKGRDIAVAMITGDARQVAEGVGHVLGIDEVFAEVLPHDKNDSVADLQGQGRTVAMVGDGVNDAPALARADVGVAIGAGTDVAIQSADVVLTSDDPRGVLSMIELSAATWRKMVQNLVWATAYNVIAVPLAAGVLAPIGFVLPPAVGAILMSASTLIVAANAQLLRRVDISPDTLAPLERAGGSARHQ